MIDPKSWLIRTRPRLVPSSEHREAVRRHLMKRIAAHRESAAGPIPPWSFAGYVTCLGVASALAVSCLLLRPPAAGTALSLDPCQRSPELCSEFRLDRDDRETVFLPVSAVPSPVPPDFRDLGRVFESLRERRTGLPTNGG